MKRTQLQRKTPLRKISNKRRAYRASDEGKAALEYMGRVKMLPCVICSAPPPSDAHHVFCGRFGSSKTSDFDVIPLCKAHHQDGPEAIHESKLRWVAKHGPDYLYIKRVKEMLGES